MPDVPLHIMLRRARRHLGLNQKALADLIGVSQATFSAYETGRQRVPKGRLLRLAEKLQIDERQALDALSEAAQILRTCPDPWCPTNSPFEIGGGEVAYYPTFFTAESIKRIHCNICGEVTLQACPGCNAALARGAACQHCGTFYVAPSVAAAVLDTKTAALQQALDRERKRRENVMAAHRISRVPFPDEEDDL